MRVRTVTPADLFGPDERHIVPLFQRPYVWTRDHQWQPLWQDIRVLAEGILSDRPAQTHFLGAIVLERIDAATEIVDGQQRLVTLQLLLHAVATVATRHGESAAATTLLGLVHRRHATADERFKVWPGVRDEDGYRAALTPASSPTSPGAGAVAAAHAYLVDAVDEWVGPPSPETGPRIHALTGAVRERVVLVAIDLESSDNAQVIFESLNHRATPLLAADLIKNMVFRAAQQQGLDALALHQRYWTVLDSRFWRRYEASNVDSGPRIDVFVRHWLVIRLLEEIPEDRVVEAFRAHLTADGRGAQDILADLAVDAQIYETIETARPGTELERFRYRVLEVLELRALTPLLLLLLRWRRDRLGK